MRPESVASAGKKNSPIGLFLRTPLSLLLPYCPTSMNVKQYLASHIAKSARLKKPLQLWYKVPEFLGH